MNDKNIINAINNKNWDILNDFFEDRTQFLLRSSIKLGLNADEAEEVVQSTWTLFLDKASSFEFKSSLNTFLYGILVNKIREYRRQKAKYQTTNDESLEFDFDSMFDHKGHWNERYPMGPEEFAQNLFSVDIIARCLDKLPELQKQAFVLKEVKDEESIDICNILQVSNTNLGVLLYRARNSLRLCIEKLTGEKK